MDPASAQIWASKFVKGGFFEAGFADRIVAAALAEQFPLVETRQDARQIIRAQPAAAAAVLGEFPCYFRSVARELAT